MTKRKDEDETKDEAETKQPGPVAAPVRDRLSEFADWWFERAGHMHPPEIPSRIAEFLDERGIKSPWVEAARGRQDMKMKAAPYSHGDTANVPAKAPLAGRPGDEDWDRKD